MFVAPGPSVTESFCAKVQRERAQRIAVKILFISLIICEGKVELLEPNIVITFVIKLSFLEAFTHLPTGSRVWIYQSDRAFTEGESVVIKTAISQFVSQWLAHKAKVIGDGSLLYDRFVILAADEEKLQVSGCSIDSTVRFIKELGAQYGVNFFDRFYTCYWDGNAVKGVDFETFKSLAASGKITDDTIVFNNVITTLDGLKNQWQIPLSKSWHSKFLTQDSGLKL
jgi:hypothetical protein